jgi:DNA (cytosine-5)-methyltransferase 1
MTPITGSLLRDHREKLGLSQAKLAEVSGVPQHALSAFELGKIDLPICYVELVRAALNDNARLEKAVSRKKRYRDHSYFQVPREAGRIARCRETAGNAEYRQLLERLEQERNRPAKTKSLSALSLFSGCGGFSLGFEWAGFKVKGFLELNPDFRGIYQANFPNSLELGSDITKVTSASLLETASQVGQIDVMIGGPPCQGFSLSGKRKVDDPRNTLFLHYLRFVDALRPSVAIVENVRLLTSMKSPSGFLVKDEIKNEFAARGYRVEYFEVNAKDFGVPQHRERVLFIAVRNDFPAQPSIPRISHASTKNLFGVWPHRTFADACSDLPYLESGESSDDPFHEAVSHPEHVIKWLWNVSEGHSAHENSNPNDRPPSGYNTTYKRQVWLEPASTIQTTFGMISGCRNVHPVATRSLTIREAARIQSFPDTFLFPGNLGTVRTAIGNAVPPLLAYSLGAHIRDKILN